MSTVDVSGKLVIDGRSGYWNAFGWWPFISLPWYWFPNIFVMATGSWWHDTNIKTISVVPTDIDTEFWVPRWWGDAGYWATGNMPLQRVADVVAVTTVVGSSNGVLTLGGTALGASAGVHIGSGLLAFRGTAEPDPIFCYGWHPYYGWWSYVGWWFDSEGNYEQQWSS